MKVRVKLFAAARELAGAEWIEVEVPQPATVAALRHAIEQQVPQLASLLRLAMIALNTEYASNSATIPTDAEVACIPPVSGG